MGNYLAKAEIQKTMWVDEEADWSLIEERGERKKWVELLSRECQRPEQIK